MSLAMQVLQTLTEARAGEVRERQFISGAVLARNLGVTRAAVWKAVRVLRQWDTPIEALPRQGYRLVLPASPLTVDALRARLPAALWHCLRQGDCEASLASTNSTLLERGAPPPGQFDFLTAEHQSAGRGRRGRRWLAAPGSAICLSWSWSFAALPAQTGALSLAVGVAARRALARCGVEGVQLKWPNDLVTAGGKLGGILIEMRSEAAGPVHVVVGLGMNVALDAAARARIAALGQPATDLASLCQPPPARAAVVAALLEEGIDAMRRFEREGFAPFIGTWRSADALLGRPVQLTGAVTEPAAGIARGIAADGALLVEQEGRMFRVVAGEVSVRPLPP
ncbi:MAG: biotin--[acetyl-CoA-carboxylase] ligase [Steroidobacteraceae bacterium]